MTACTYCGSDLTAHGPVRVAEGPDEDGTPAGRFCNYACLRAWIDEEEKAAGAACEWEP